MPKQCQYWYFEECPFKEDCSKASWKRAKCSGKTPALAKEALKLHLVRSSNHQLSDEHANIVVCDTDMKSCMMDCDDEEIDETQVDEKKVKVEEVDETKSSSVILIPRKKRKFDDSDLDEFLFDANNKVEQGLHSLAIAKTAMLEAKLALKKAHLLSVNLARGRTSRGSSD